MDEDTCFDTVSLVGQRNSGRRLRLRWSEHTPPANPTRNVHDRRMMRVRAAMQRDNRPPEVRRAKWSGLWRSVSDKRIWRQVCPEPVDANSGQFSTFLSCGQLQRGIDCAQCCSGWHNQHSTCPPNLWRGHDAVLAGWEALHQALNVMGIQSSKGCQSGFQAEGSHNHFWVPISAGVRKNDS